MYRKFAKGGLAVLLFCLGFSFLAQAQLEDVSEDVSVPVEEVLVDSQISPFKPQLNEDGLPLLTKADVDAWLDGYMHYALEIAGVKGAVVSVVKDGEILTSRGFGFADVETRRLMDGETTIVRPGSISKLFTWTAVMQLVENGSINLDADINDYLDFEIESPFGEPITMRHIMTHTAGFEEVLHDLIINDPEKFIALETYLKSYIPPRIFAPGTTPAYSNYATSVAGYVVSRISGQPLEAYIKANIFDPLGMNSSTFAQPLPARFEDRMSKGYPSNTSNDPGEYELIPAAPAGALASTASDMARFMIAHLDAGGPLLTRETSEQMMTPQMIATPPLNSMALGFYVQDFNNLRSRGHGGDTTLFHSDLYLLLDENVGLFLSMNTSGPMDNMLRAELSNKFTARYFADASQEFEPRLDTAMEHAAQVVGAYEPSRSSQTTFIALMGYLGQFKVNADRNGDLLLMTMSPTPSRWREVEPFVWRRVGGHERFAAQRDENGSITHVTFEPVSPFTIFMKPPWYRSSGLLNPLLYLSLIGLFLTVVMWPVRAVVRRRYKYKLDQKPRERRSYHLVRIGIVLMFVVLLAWIRLVATLQTNLVSLSEASFMKTLLVTQLSQVLFYVALGFAVWNGFVVWKAKQSWFAKLWSVVIILSILVVIWFAAISGLLHIGASF
jgi:CubicO group peptidase (beta-lactamase class C family)